MIDSPAHILPVAAESYSDKVALVTEDVQLSFADRCRPIAARSPDLLVSSWDE